MPEDDGPGLAAARGFVRRIGRGVARRVRPAAISSRLGPAHLLEFYGRGNDRHHVEWYRNLTAWEESVRLGGPAAPVAYLVGQNFLDERFVRFSGPKVFCTFEAHRHMTAETVAILDSGVVDAHHFSYGDPDPEQRMCYPALDPDHAAMGDALERRVDERRSGIACLVNRPFDPEESTLYPRRLEVLEALGDSIDLYGFPARADGRLWDHPRYRGAPADKRTTIASYTFNVCIENVDEPGYVTEKVIDAIAAGCVPLYHGGGGLAGDIVPPACFVDCRDLASGEVAELVATMRHDEVVEYRRAGIAFLRSEAAARFTHDDHRRRIAARLRSAAPDA